MTIHQLSVMLKNIYDRSNRVFISNLVERINFLNLAVGHLQDTVRKHSDDRDAVSLALARVMAWTFCVVHNFDDLDMAKALSSKFPNTCGYCKHIPCDCDPKNRKVHKITEPSAEQIAWGIAEWQNHFDKLYGPANRRRGIENTINRMFKEVCELLELAMGTHHLDAPVDELEHEFALEAADVIAWCFAAAILLEIDLSKAMFDQYGNGCSVCHKVPCECRRYFRNGDGNVQRIASSTLVCRKM